MFLLQHLDGLDVAAIGAQLSLDAEAVEQQLRSGPIDWLRASRTVTSGHVSED